MAVHSQGSCLTGAPLLIQAIPYRYGDGESSGQFRQSLGLHPKLNPATFTMDGLDDGPYTITVLTGSNGAFPVW